MAKYVCDIVFENQKSFDTLEEAMKFKALIGTRFKACYKLEYPDMTFYVVEYDAE